MLHTDISDYQIRCFRKLVTNAGVRLYVGFPWRDTKNHWHALVAEIMLQRTQADQVVTVYLEFCAKYSTPEEFLADSDSNVFETLGLIWRNKVLKSLARVLIDRAIPSEKKALLELPGVGDYIASAYRSFHLGTTDRIIDSNIVRLYGRYFGFLTHAETRRQNWFIRLVERVTPNRDVRKFNYALIDFTRQICKANPLCESCNLRQRCCYALKRTTG